MQSQYQKAGQTLTHYYDFGNPEKGTVVFLHGWRSEAAAFAETLKTLASSGYRVIAPDLPGFGKTTFPKGAAWGLSDYLVVVTDLLDSLELKEVILIGHSFGGRLAIKLAATKPEYVGQLVLASAAGFIRKKTLTKRLAKLVRPLFQPAFMQSLRKRIYKMIGAEDYVSTPELRNTFRKVIAEDLTELMTSVKARTLLVWGDEDKMTPLSFGERMNKLIADSKLVVLSGVGHFPFIEAREAFEEHLIQFLNE